MCCIGICILEGSQVHFVCLPAVKFYAKLEDPDFSFRSSQLFMLGHVLSLSPGQETWIRKLKWGELPKFNQLKWKPLHSDPKSSETSAFVKSHKNLAFYWILRAGHMVRSQHLFRIRGSGGGGSHMHWAHRCTGLGGTSGSLLKLISASLE